MNKIFKILWNKVRSAHVVTDETKTSCGKGRQGSTLVKTVAGGAAASILAGALGALLPTAGLAASVITRPGGTELKPTNGRFDITAQKVQDGTGVNRFDQFKLDKGNIANLHFSTQVGGGKAERLLNFVNTGIEVNGTVNALKNGKIGGDLYFISPEGMMVGSTGVINAGSLTVAVPTKDRYDEWITAVENGSTTHQPYSEKFAQALEEGAYPINPKGVITVAGSINAGNRVALSAAQIEVKSGARIETGVSNFADMVNIKDESGSITADAGLGEADLSFVPDDDSGDILLVARSEGDDSSLRLPWEEGVGLGNLTATKVDRKASITVEEDAVVKATGDITAEASASNTSYDVERGTFFPEPEEGDVNQNVNGKTGIASANVTADVTIAGTLEAGGDVNLSAETVNVIDHTFGFNFATVSEQIGGSLFANLVGSTVEYVNLSGRSNVTVAEGGSVTAGGNITANAENRTRVEVGDSTAWKNYGHLFSTDKESKIPVAAVAVALVDATSNVTIDGTLRTDKNLTLTAKNDYDVDVGTISTIQGTSQPQGSLVVGDFTSDAFVTVGGSAVLGSKTDGGQMGKVTAAAETANRVETSAETYVAPEGNIALAINVTDFDSAADVTFQNGLASTASEIDIHALNKTETLDVLSKTTVGDRGILMKLQGFAADTAMGLFDKLTGIANQIGNDKASGTIGTAKFQLGGAVGVVTNNQSASVSLDDFGRSFTADGNVTVKSESILADHHYEVTTKQQIDQNAGNEGKEGQGAVAVLVVESSPDDIFDETGTKVGERPSENVSSSVTIAADTVLQSLNGIVEAASHTDITKDRFEFLKKELEQSLLNFGSFFASDTQWKDSADEFETARKNLINAFDALGSGDSTSENFGKFVDAMGAFADFLAATFGVPGTVTGIASAGLELGYDILDIVNPISYTNAYVSAGSVTNDAQTDTPISIAASVGYVSQTVANTLTIDHGAKLQGTEVNVKAESKNGNIAMGGYLDNFFGFPLPNRDNAKAMGATVVYNTVSSDNLLRLNEGVSLVSTAGNLNVTAKDAFDVATITATAGVNAGGLTLSGLAAVTDANGANRLWIDDEVSISAEGEGADIGLTAERDDSVQTVAGGLGVTTSDQGGSNASVGAGVAVNLGGLTNELAVRNLETAEDGNHFTSAGALTAADEIGLVAESTINVNAIGVAGQVAAQSTGSGAAADATSQLDDAAEDALSETERLAQGYVASGTAQNGFDSDMGWMREGGGFSESGSSGTRPNIGTAANAEHAQNAASTLNLAAAGSFAWNDVDQTNTVDISSEALGGEKLAMNGESLRIEAVTDKWMGAIAGAAGVSAVLGSNGTSLNASIGGVAAINQNRFKNTISIKGLTTTTDTMTVHSLVNGTTVAEGLGMAVAAGAATTSVGIDAGVSVNNVTNDVGVAVSDLTNEDDGDDKAFVYDQAAWSGETQVTGGTSVGVAAGGSGASAVVGASVAVASITNNITSALENSNFTKAQSVDVKALASLTQVNTAVGAQVAQGSGVSAAVSGAVISGKIENNVSTNVSNSAFTMADVENASVTIASGTAGTGEGGAAQAYVERAQGVEGVFTREELLNEEFTANVSLKKDNQENGESMNVQSDILAGGDMTQVSVALGVGVGAGGGAMAAAGSAGVIATELSNRFTTDTSGLSVTKAAAGGKDFRYAQTAASGVNTVNVAAGVSGTGGGSFNLSVGGSAIVSGVDQTARSTATDLTVEASDASTAEDGSLIADTLVAAENNAHTVNVAGNAGVTVGGAGVGAGASVVVANIRNEAEAQLSNSTLTGDGASSVTVSAQNEAESWSAAVNGTVAANAAIGGSYVQNNVSNNALAVVTGTKLDGLDALHVSAADGSELWTLSGNVSVNYSPGAAVGAAVGGAVSYANAYGTTSATADTIDNSSQNTNLYVGSDAADAIHTLTLGLSVSPTAGLAGSVGINTIDRTVTSVISGLGGGYRYDDVFLTAQSREDIDNLGIVIAGSGGASIGAGVAVNTIDTDVSVNFADSNFTSGRTLVEAASANDIDTIGVGVAGAAAAVGGSVSISKILGDTSVSLQNVENSARDAIAVLAQSDDVIGSYGGQVTAAGGAAVGLSVSMAERTGNTSVTIATSKLTETGNASNAQGLTVQGGVADEHINNDIAEDVSVGATLEDKRDTVTVDGIRITATSTATYKTLAVNAAAASGVEVAGSASSVTHVGKTQVTLTGDQNQGSSSMQVQASSDVDVLAGDYANFMTSLTTVGGAVGVAGNVGTALVDTMHETGVSIESARLESTAADTRVDAEAKEGVSALTTVGGAAGGVAATVAAAVTNLKSSVLLKNEYSSVYSENRDGTVSINTHYLGQITNLGVAAAGAGGGAAVVNVALNTIDTDVRTDWNSATLSARGSTSISSGRDTSIRQFGATASGSLIAAGSAFVAENDVGGETVMEIEGSQIGTNSQNDESNTAITVENNDRVAVDAGSLAAGLTAGAGVSVVVNKLHGDAGILIENTQLLGPEGIRVTAEQNRFVDATVALVQAGAVAIGANVIATEIGESTNDNATIFGDAFKNGDGSTSGDDPTDTIEGYQNQYGHASADSIYDYVESVGVPNGVGNPAAEEPGELPPHLQPTHVSGTRVEISGWQNSVVGVTHGLSSQGPIEIAAREDVAEGAGVHVTVGSGTGGVIGAAASVATLTRHNGAVVSLTDLVVPGRYWQSWETNDISLGAYASADDAVEVWQAGAGLATGNAAYAEVNVDGTVGVKVDNVSMKALTKTEDEAIRIEAVDDRTVNADANGINAAVVAAGGMVADVNDASNVAVTVNQASFVGNVDITAKRAQTLAAHALAGYGGALTGMGSSARVSDAGRTLATLTNVTAQNAEWTETKIVTEPYIETAEDGTKYQWWHEVPYYIDRTGQNHFDVNVEHRPHLDVSAKSAGGAALAVGVVQASADVCGGAALQVTGGSIATAAANFDVSAGRQTDDAEDALRINAEIDSYGGSGVGVYVNSASVTNEAQVSAEMSGTTFGANTTVDLDAEAFADYDAVARAASGALIRSDNNCVEVLHGADVTVKLTGAAAGTTAGSFDVEARSDEDARLEASSAGGSVVDVGARAVELSHADTSTVKVNVAGTFATTGDMSVSATVDRNVAFLGRNTTGTILGGNGAALSNSIAGGVDLTVADGTSLTAGGELALTADNRWSVGSADGEEYALDTGVYGALAGNGIEINNAQDTHARVSIGKSAKLLSTDAMTVAAKTTGMTALSLNSRSAGVASLANIAGTQTVKTENEVTVGEGASLKTLSSDGTMTLSASGDETHAIKVIGTVEGAAVGKSEAKLDVDYSLSNNLSIGKNASLRSGRNIELFAGRDASGADAVVDLLGYTYAISRSAIAPVLSSMTDSYDAKNLVTVAEGASVTSTENIDVVASAGDFTTRSEARYWNWTSAGDAGEVEIASTGTGTTAKNAKLTNEVRMDGTMLAGVNTHASITIDGLILPPTNPEAGQTAPTPNFDAVSPDNLDTILSVKAGDATAVTDIQNGISVGTEESANLYWDRHQELQNLIAELSATAENAAVLAAYKAEDQALIEIMTSDGLAYYNDRNQLVASTSVQLPYVSVSGVTVSGGNVSFTTDKVTGKGSVTANAAEGIEIVNNSNYALYVDDIHILSQGGCVTMNGTNVRTGDVRDDFSLGSLKTATSATAPTIEISSNYTGNLTYSGTDESGKPVTTTTRPDTSIVIRGDVINNAGAVTIESSKDLIQNSGVTVRAAGNLTLYARGNVTQYYTSGVHSIGGNVEDAWEDAKDKLDQAVTESEFKEGQETKFESNEVRGGSGGIIAGGDIIVSGQMINLNGTVQSGFASYELTLVDGQPLMDEINAVVNRWTTAGSKTNINVRTDDFLISEGGYKRNSDGSYSWQVAAWYDPVNKRIVLDDIQPEGGHVYISGGIASTGGGHIYAAQGTADVTVKVGSYDVVTGVVDTGLSDGLIRITDTNYGDATHSAKVTEWTSRDGAVSGQTWMLDLSGNKIDSTISTVDIRNGYDPRDNLLYMWSWGYQTGQINHSYAEDGFTWWGGFNWDRLDKQLQDTWVEPITDKNSALTPGATIAVGGGQATTAQGVINTSDVETGEWEYTTWTTYDDALHWKGTHHVQGEQTVTGTKVVTFSVKADEHITTGFLGGKNTVSIATGGSLLLGGSVTAENGTVGLTAGGDILNQTADASIRDASSLTLRANGNIGSATDAIRLSGGTGTMNVTANAGGSLYLDGGALTVDTLSGTFTAGQVASVTSRNDLHVADVTANDIRLTSTEGNIRVDDVHQTASIEGTERFDAEALNGSIDVTVTEGDLGLGQVVANDESGRVTITVENGTVFDALPRDAESGITTEERLDAWKAAGILGENGENVGAEAWAADVAAAEENLRNDYARYEAYQSMAEGELSADARADYAVLSERFSGYDSADAAVAGEKADETTALYKINASENYGWTQNDLLYAVAEAVANPDPGYVPTAGAANVKADRVEITTTTGSVGINRDAVTGFVSTEGDGLELLKLLAQADVDDVTWHKDGSVTVQLKRPITVESNAFAAHASGDLFVQSTDESALRIEEAIAGGALRLTSALGVYSASNPDGATSPFGVAQGATVTIRGGEGGIGTEDASLLVNHGDDGWAALSSNGDIFVDASGDDLTIYSVSGGSDVTLSAGSITSYSGEAVDMGDESFDFGGLGYLSSGEEGVIHLEVAGDLGTADNALRFASDAMLDVAGELQNAWLTSVEGEGTLDVQTLSANGLVSVTAANDLRFGNVSGSSVTATAAHDLTVAGSVESTSQASLSSTEGTLSVTDGAVITAGTIDLTANAGTDETGTVGKVNVGKATLTATEALNVTGAAGVTMTGTSVNPEATDPQTVVKVTAETGDVVLDEVALKADSLTAEALAGSLDTTGLDASDIGSVQLSASDGMVLDQMTIEAESVILTTAGDLSASNSVITATADKVALTSTGGSVTTNDSQISAVTSVELNAATDVNVAGESTSVSAESTTLTATTGAVDMSNADFNVDTSLTVTGASGVNMTGTTLTAGSLTASASAGSLNASNLEATVLGVADLSGANVHLTGETTKFTAHEATVSSSSGTVDAANADFVVDSLLNVTGAAGVVMTGTTVNEGEESSAVVTITATSGDTDLTGAFLTAGSLTASATAGTLNASNLEATVSGVANLFGANVHLTGETTKIAANEATVSSSSGAVDAANADFAVDSSLTVTGASGVVMTGTTVNEGEESFAVVTVTATSGDADLRGASLTAGSLTASATAGTLNASNLEATVSGAANLAAETGMILNGSDVKASSVTVSSKGDLLATDAKLVATQETLSLTSISGTVSTQNTELTGNTNVAITGANVNLVGKTTKVTTKEATVEASSGTVDASNADFFVDTSLTVTGASGVIMTGSSINEAEESSGVTVTVTASSGDADLSNTSVTAGSLTVSVATGTLVGTGLEATLSGTANLAAETGMILNGSDVRASSVTALSKGGLSATAAKLEAVQETLSLTSTFGTVAAQNAELTANAAVTVTGANVHLTGETTKLTANEATVSASSGTVDAANADFAVDSLLNVTGAAGVVMTGTTVNEGEESSAVVTITATSGDADLTGASLTAGSLTASATAGTLDASNLEATVSGVANLASETGMILNGSDVRASSVTASSKGDLSARAAKLEAVQETLSLTSTSGTVAAQNAELTANAAVTVTGSNVNLAGETTRITANEATVTASSGAVDASNTDFAVDSSLTVTGAAGVDMTGATLTAGSLTASATAGTLIASNLEATVSGAADLSGANVNLTGKTTKITANEATISASSGTVDATNADFFVDTSLTVTGASGVIMTGSSINEGEESSGVTVTVTASSGDADLSNASVTAGSLTVSAATGKFVGTGLEATLSGTANLAAETEMILNGSDVRASSVTASSKGDLSATAAKLEAVQKTLSLTSTAGTVSTQNTELTGNANVAIIGANVNLVGETTKVTTKEATIEASSGTVNASNADFAVDSSLTVTGAAGVDMTGTTVNEGEESSAVVTITATSGDADLTGASLTAGSLTASATVGMLDASNLEATVSGVANLATETGMILNGSDVRASSVTASSKGDLSARAAKLEAVQETLSLTSTSGTVAAQNAELTANAAVTVTGSNVNFAGETTKVSASEATVTASSGSVDASNTDFSVDSSLTVTGASDVVMTGASVNEGEESSDANVTVTASSGDADLTNAFVAAGSFTASAGRNVSAENSKIAVGTDDTGAAGDVSITASSGDVDLTDAKLIGTSGGVGDVVVSAGANALFDGLMKTENDFHAESVAVSAGDAVNFGDAPQSAVVSKGDFSVTASKLEGTGFGKGKYSVAEGDFRVDVDSDVTLNEGFNVAAKNVDFHAGGFTADSVTIRGEETVLIAASDDVALSGETLVTADESVSISSAMGGIAMTDAVTVGDESADENKAKVTLTAKDDVMQFVTSGDGGLRGSDLTVTSNEGAVDLGAGRDETVGSQGNAFDRITVEAAEDVTIATSGRDTKLAVNEKQNGTVNGDLNVIGEDNGLTFTGNLTVKGDATIRGAAVKGEGLAAEGAVGILTALDDGEREPGEFSGVEFTGPISGTQVTVITAEGGITLDRVTSTEGSTDIYRVGDKSVADVTVGGVDSATTVTIFNNRGDNVLTGPVRGEDDVFALTGDEGTTSGSHHLDSSGGVAGAIGGLGEFADEVIAGLPSGSGGGWHPSELPTIRLDGLMSDAGQSVHADPLRIQWMPTDEFFFLHLRPDAKAVKVESDEDEERPALEEGLPARVEPVITDHRKVTPQTLEELGLLLSCR